MKTHFFNYLRFNRTERNGTLALMLLVVLLFAIPEITHWLRPRGGTDFSAFRAEISAFRNALFDETAPPSSQAPFVFDPNTASFEDFIRLGLSEKVANIICNYRDKGAKFREPADFQKIWSLQAADYERLSPYIQIGQKSSLQADKFAERAPAELFSFDPNTANETDFLRLGLPARTIKSILNYRSKGGQFRKVEDLEKIYTLDETDYARIAHYATFSEDIASAKPMYPVTYAGGAFVGAKSPLDSPVDINRAGVEAWKNLPGIGETRARQLVNYREKLGGFLSPEQLREVRILPDSVLQSIQPQLVISTPEVRKINLNTASVADLDAHPYISKRQAELIVAYREHHGPFSSADEIGQIRAISDQAWLAKVKPYLGVE
jgi:DNA uptake protein ComE-like DNA-binding protein